MLISVKIVDNNVAVPKKCGYTCTKVYSYENVSKIEMNKEDNKLTIGYYDSKFDEYHEETAEIPNEIHIIKITTLR